MGVRSYKSNRNWIKSVEKFTGGFSIRRSHVSRKYQSDLGSALIVTVDDTTNSELSTGDVILFERFNTGDLNFTSSGSMILDSEGDLLSVAEKQVVVSLTKTGNNRMLLVGKLK